MPHIALIIDTFAVLGALFALWKGGAAERATAVIIIGNLVVGQLGGLADPGSQGAIRLANDAVTALALLTVTIRYAAIWMGVVMLLHAVQFAMHSYYLTTGRKSGDYLHALINNIDFTGIIICLILGTLVAWRRRASAAAALPNAA